MDDLAAAGVKTAVEKNAQSNWTGGNNAEAEGETHAEFDSHNCVGNPVGVNPKGDHLLASNERQDDHLEKEQNGESKTNKLIFNKRNHPNSCLKFNQKNVAEMNKYEYAYEREDVFSCEDAFGESVESNNLSSYDEEEREQIDPLNGYHNGQTSSNNRGSERQNCQVIVRIKPRIKTNKLEKVSKLNENDTTGRGINYEDGKNIKYKKNCLYVHNQNFSFDKIFSEETKQVEVYSYLSDTFLNNLFEGYNCTIFAYGQTGSGKTFTMGFDYMNEFSQSVGILPRFLNDMFKTIERKKRKIDFDVSCTYIEIYNEEIIDLIDFKEEDYHEKVSLKNGKKNKKKKKINKNISIREDINKKEIILMGIKNEKVQTVQDVFTILHKGNLFRTTERTFMNDKSSRSHAIFTVNLIQRKKQAEESEKNKGNPPEGDPNCRNEQGAVNHLGEEPKRRSLNGSDVAEEGATDNAAVHTNADEGKKDLNFAKEGNHNGEGLEHTNKADVICSKFHFVDLAGSERAKRTETKGHRLKEAISINYGLLSLSNVIYSLSSNKKSQHVPYRNSKLTRILQDSLGGNSKTVMIACISIDPVDFYESLSTIKYAARTKKIKNTPVINYDINSVVINDLRKQLFNLNLELKKYKIECKDKSSEVDFTRVKELTSQNKLLLQKVKGLKVKRKKLICLIFYYMGLLKRPNYAPTDGSLRSNVVESVRSCSVGLLHQKGCIPQGGEFPSNDGQSVAGGASAIVHSGDRAGDNAIHITSAPVCKNRTIVPDVPPSGGALSSAPPSGAPPCGGPPSRPHFTMSVDSFFQKRGNLDKEDAANVNSKFSEPGKSTHGGHCSSGMAPLTVKGTPMGDAKSCHSCGLKQSSNEHLVEKNSKKEHDMNVVVSGGSYEVDTGETCHCVERPSLQKRDDQAVHMNRATHDNRNIFQESVMWWADNANEGDHLTSVPKDPSGELSPNVMEPPKKDAPNGDTLNGNHSLCTTCQTKNMVEDREDACDSDFNTLEEKYLFVNLEEDKRCVENLFRQFELNRYNERKLRDLNKKYNSIFEKNKAYEKKIDELKKMVKRMKRCAKLSSEGRYGGGKRKKKKAPKGGRSGTSERSGRRGRDVGAVGGSAKAGPPKRQNHPDGRKNLPHSPPQDDNFYPPNCDHFSDVEFEREMKRKMLKHFARKKNLTDTEVSVKGRNSFCAYGTGGFHEQTRLMDLLHRNLNHHKKEISLIDNPQLNSCLVSAGRHRKVRSRRRRRIPLSENNDSASSNFIYSSNNVDLGLFEDTAEVGEIPMGSNGRRGGPINGEKGPPKGVPNERKKKQVQMEVTDISHPYDHFVGGAKMDGLHFANYAGGEVNPKWYTSDEEEEHSEDDTCESSPSSSDDGSGRSSGNVSPKFLKNKLNKLQKIIKEDICKIKRVNREKEEYNAKNELLTNSIMSLKKKLHYLQVSSQNDKNCKKIENMKGEIQRITNEKQKIQKKLNDNEQQIKHLKVDILKMKSNFLKTSTLLKEEQRKHTNIIRKKENIITKLHEREEHYINKLKKKEEISKQAYSKLLKRNQELNEELKKLKKKGPSGNARRGDRKKGQENRPPEGIIQGNKFDGVSTRVKKVTSDGMRISTPLRDGDVHHCDHPDDGNNGGGDQHRGDDASLQNDDYNASPLSTILSDGVKSAYLNSSPSVCNPENNLFPSHSFYMFNKSESKFQSSFKNDAKIKSYLREFLKKKKKLSSIKAKLDKEKSMNRQVRKILQALYVKRKNEDEEGDREQDGSPRRSTPIGVEDKCAPMSRTTNEGKDGESSAGQPMTEQPLRNRVIAAKMEQNEQNVRDCQSDGKDSIPVKENFPPVEDKDGGENPPILLRDEKMDEEVAYYENKLKESNELLKKLKRDIVTKKEEFILQKVVKHLLKKLYFNFNKRKESERKIKSLKKFIYSENLFISKIYNNFFYLTNVANNLTLPIGGNSHLNNHPMVSFYSNQINDPREGHPTGGFHLTCAERQMKNNNEGLSALLPRYKFDQFKGVLPRNGAESGLLDGRRRNTFSSSMGINPTAEVNQNFTNLKKRSYKSRLIENLHLSRFNKRRVVLCRSDNLVESGKNGENGKNGESGENGKNGNFEAKWGKRYSDGFSLNRMRDAHEGVGLEANFNGGVPAEEGLHHLPKGYEQINWMPNEGAKNNNLSALNLLHDNNIFGKSEKGSFIRRVHADSGGGEDQSANAMDAMDAMDAIDVVDAEERSLEQTHHHALPNVRMKRKTIDNCYLYASKQNGDNFLDYYQDVFSRGHYDVKGAKGEEEKTQRDVTTSDPSQRLLCGKSGGEPYQGAEAPQREPPLCNSKGDQMKSSPVDLCVHPPTANTTIGSDAFSKGRNEFASSKRLEGRVPHEGCNPPGKKGDHISSSMKRGSQELNSALTNVRTDGEDCSSIDTAKKGEGTIGGKYDNGECSAGTGTGMYSSPCGIPIEEESKTNLLPSSGRTDQHLGENKLDFNLAPRQMSGNGTHKEDGSRDPIEGDRKQEVTTEVSKTVRSLNVSSADGVKKRQPKVCSIKSKSADGNSRTGGGVSNVKRACKEKENKSSDASLDGTNVTREANNTEVRNINSEEESQMRRKNTSIDAETKLVKKAGINKLPANQTEGPLHHTVLVQKGDDTSHKAQGAKLQMDPASAAQWNSRTNRDEPNCGGYSKPNEMGEGTQSNNLQYGINREDFKKIEKIHEESINIFKNKMNDIGMNSESFGGLHMMEKKIKGNFANSGNYDGDNTMGDEFPFNKGTTQKRYKTLCMKNCHKYGVSGLCVKGSSSKGLTILSSSINNIKLWDGKKAVWNYDHVNLKNEKSTFINSLIVSFQNNCFFAGINSYVHLFDIRTNPVSLQKYYYSDKNDGSLLISLLNDKSDYVPFLLQNGCTSTFSGVAADGDYTYGGVQNVIERNAVEDAVGQEPWDTSLKHPPSREWQEENVASATHENGSRNVASATHENGSRNVASETHENGNKKMGSATHQSCHERGNQSTTLCHGKADAAEEDARDKLKPIRDAENFQSEYCICACGNENFIKVFDIRKNDDNMWLAKIPITNKIEYITQIPMKKNGKNITKDSNILKNIIIASRDKTVKIWKKGWVSFYPPSYDWCTSLSNFNLSDLMINKGTPNLQEESAEYANNLFNYDSLIVSGSRDSHLRFWLYATDSTTNEFNRFMKIVKNAHMVDITSIAKYQTSGLVTADRDGFIQMWDCNLSVNDNEKALLDMDIYSSQLNLAVNKMGKTLRHSPNAINKVVCYENHFLTASSDGSIKIFSEK